MLLTTITGETIPLQRKSPLSTITSAAQSRALLGEDTLTVDVLCSEARAFTIGDTTTAFGEIYTINRLPRVARKDGKFLYTLSFEGSQYSLRRPLFRDVDEAGVSSGFRFDLTGDLATFAGVLMTCIQGVYPGWTLGDVPNRSSTKTLSFDGVNCLAALQTLCQEFGTEFELVRKSENACVLNLKQVGSVLGQTFAYGKAKGLYELERDNVADRDFITRLYVEGGNKNIPSTYRSGADTLRLPGGATYIENAKAVAAFGVIEGSKVFEDVFPRRTGTITTVAADGLSFTDTGLDFDLMAQLQPGLTAKVSMKTGSLAGYGFEVLKYVHPSKTVFITPFKNDQGMELPSGEVFALAPGDTYVLLDITMPDTYVTAAEADLQRVATEYLNNNSAPRVQYSLTVDDMYLQRRDTQGSTTNFFALGDYVQIVDSDLNIDKASRVLAYERNVLEPYKYTLTIADSYEISIVERILSDIAETKTVIRINSLYDSKRALYGWRAGQELLGLFFDTDGFFDGGRIKPETIQTGSIAVGAKSQQLILNVVMEPNFNGLVNSVRVNAGTLVHYTIDESGPKTWQLTAQLTSLNDNAARFVYAKCHRTDYRDALISFDTAQRKVDSDATYYYFLIGYLHSVAVGSGVRFISLTYGATTINGRFIRTGRIQSADGGTYFDLDSGEIGGNIKFVGNGGGDTSLEQLEAEFTFFQNVTIPNLRRSLSGRIVSYFQEDDPNTWSGADRVNHDGDMWYRPSIKKLYSYSRQSNSWVENPDKTAVAAYEKASQAKDTADGKRRNFIVTPFTPYDEGDLWTDGSDLRKCVRGKDVSQQYNPVDWDKATNYDSTTTTINGGIVTSGTILLGAITGAIRAGITGVGNLLTSVRFWAGASFENREFAPFRVLDSGEVFARKRIELQDQNQTGQAGICGANSADDGDIRMWAGVSYDSRQSAPWQVFKDGFMKFTKGVIGKLQLVDGGLLAEMPDATVDININRPDASVGGADVVNIRSRTYTDNPNVLRNIALLLESDNASSTNPTQPQARSYAVFVKRGISLLREALLNGRKHVHFGGTGNVGYVIETYHYDSCSIYHPTGNAEIRLSVVKDAQNQTLIDNGKEVTIANLSATGSEVYIMETQANNGQPVRLEGGKILTFVYYYGNWLVKSIHQNAFSSLPNVPSSSQSYSPFR